jgi:hypothetical protein
VNVGVCKLLFWSNDKLRCIHGLVAHSSAKSSDGRTTSAKRETVVTRRDRHAIQIVRQHQSPNIPPSTPSTLYRTPSYCFINAILPTSNNLPSILPHNATLAARQKQSTFVSNSREKQLNILLLSSKHDVSGHIINPYPPCLLRLFRRHSPCLDHTTPIARMEVAVTDPRRALEGSRRTVHDT